MHHPSRPPSCCDGSVTATQRSGGGPPAGAPARTSRSPSAGAGEPDPSSRCGTASPADGLAVFQTRSIFCRARRASSGYFSHDGDSLPSSPLSPRPPTADRATQTASPTGQLLKHALERLAAAHGGGGGPGTHQRHGPSLSPSSTRPRNAEGDMQTQEIGQELRRIGDDFNRLLLRGGAGRQRQGVELYPNPLPRIHQEPTMLLCVGLLLLLIGRIILQGSTVSPDHSQV